MPAFSKASLAKLDTCHPDLQKLFLYVVEDFDCTIIEGHRDRAAQEAAFASGHSKAHFGQSSHNSFPSRAVDVMPYPVDYEDWKRLYAFGGYVLACARHLGVNVKWGAKWSGEWVDLKRAGELFGIVDAPHWELLPVPRTP